MPKEKTPNYDDEAIEALKTVYDPSADQETRDQQVNKLAETLGRKKQSIIAKLVNLKIYVKKVHTGKDGEPTMNKDERVTAIARDMGIVPELLDSLAKANVSVIKMIQDTVTAKNMAEKNLESVMQAATDAGFDLEDLSEGGEPE